MFAQLVSSARGHLAAAVERYRTVLSAPGATGFFIPAVLARLGIAMTALGLLWEIRSTTHSFAFAGLVSGVFAGAEGLGGPQIARLVDASGQGKVVPKSLGIHAVMMTALLVMANERMPVGAIVPVAAAAGATIPQAGALSSARWPYVLDEKSRLATAYSLEAAVNDVVFLSGPVIVTIVAAKVSPAVGLICSSALIVGGTATLVLHRATEPPALGRGPGVVADRRLFTPTYRALAAINLCMGFYFGSSTVAVGAFAIEHHAQAIAGFIFGSGSVTSLVAGLIYGSTRNRWHPRTILLVFSLYLTVGLAGLSVVSSISGLWPISAGLGCAIAPVMITTSVLLERSTPPEILTQAFAWINSCSVAGIAIASPIVGASADVGGPRAGFIAAAGLLVLMPMVVGVAWKKRIL